MKYILIIGDGMADEYLPELDGKTPLEHAKTPAMDALASAGVLGTAVTIPHGVPAGSDTATLSILGCDPKKYYSGRAPIEAAALGIALAPGDTAYRCNMVTLGDARELGVRSEELGVTENKTIKGSKNFDNKKLISHSAGSIDGKTSDVLIKDLFSAKGFKEAAKAAGVEVHPGGSFRHIAVQRKGTGAAGLTPPHEHLGETVGQLITRKGNAGILTDLMEKAHEILDNHPVNEARRAEGKLPANGIWFWAEGSAARLPDFKQRYNKTGSVIAAVPNCQGIGMLMGLDKITVPGATGELDTNYEGKVDAAISSLETHDFAVVHIEAPDECTHDGDLEGKLKAIELIDSRIVAPLAQRLHESGAVYRMLIISDHKTLMRTRGHDSSPVPFVLFDSRSNSGTGLRYSELAAEARGTYKDIDGTALMRLLFSDSDR